MELVAGVAVAAMLSGIAMTLTQEGAMREIVRLSSGLTILLTLLIPLSRLDLKKGFSVSGLFSDEKAVIEQSAQQNDQLAYDSMSRAAAQYINQKAENLGLSCDVTVTVGLDEDETITLKGATIVYEYAEPAVLEAVQQMIAYECGIPPERQQYVEK